MARNRFVSTVVGITGACIVAGLYRLNYGPYSHTYGQYLIVNLMGLLWLPMLVILFVLRDEPAQYGFSLGLSRRIWLWVGALFVALLLVLIPASRFKAFQDYYPLFKQYREFTGAFVNYPKQNPFITAPWLMIYAEASYGMYLFCWEFFFRGYLLQGLARSIGWGAVLAQAAAFTILHAGKPTIEIVSSFGAGIILGMIAMNARSFVPCYVLHWAASITFDLLVIANRHT